MNLTDRLQKEHNSYGKLCTESNSQVLSSSKRKGISLSKLTNEKNRCREHSFIKLSARNKKSFVVQKRQIKLIVKPRPQIEQNFNLLMENSKENNVQTINFQPQGQFVKTIQIHINTAPNLMRNTEQSKKIQSRVSSKQKQNKNIKKLLINNNKISKLQMLRL